MDTQKKLQTIKRILGLTQTELAEHFGVSFVAFNSWWNGRSSPHPKNQTAIDDLFMEVTGQKTVPAEELAAKKKALLDKRSRHKNVATEILDNPDIRDRMVLKLTYHSNSIEGNTLTEPDTAAVLFDNVALPDKSLAEQMEAKNHQAALGHVFERAAQDKPIDRDLPLRLHGMLMNGIRPDAGAYRRHAVRITGVNLPTANHLRIPELMPAVMADAAKAGSSKDIIGLSAAVHSRFEKIHPFSDGNGRVGRLILAAMLLKAGLPPAIIRQEQKRLYYTFLYKSQTSEDQSQLEKFFCDAMMDGFGILERKDI